VTLGFSLLTSLLFWRCTELKMQQEKREKYSSITVLIVSELLSPVSKLCPGAVVSVMTDDAGLQRYKAMS
jgi:hypothetical protein